MPTRKPVTFQKYSNPTPVEPVSASPKLGWVILLGCVFTGVVGLVTPGFIGWLTLAISVVLGLFLSSPSCLRMSKNIFPKSLTAASKGAKVVTPPTAGFFVSKMLN